MPTGVPGIQRRERLVRGGATYSLSKSSAQDFSGSRPWVNASICILCEKSKNQGLRSLDGL